MLKANVAFSIASLLQASFSHKGWSSIWLGEYLPVCRDLVVTSYQKHITQLFVLQVSLHLPEGLFCMVCGLEKFI